MIEPLIPKLLAPLWNATKFEIGGWRLVLYLVLMLWTSWFGLYWSSFFTTTTNNNRENIYSEYKSKIFRFLNSSPQDSTSWIHNNSDYSSLDPKNIDSVEWVTQEDYTVSHNRV